MPRRLPVLTALAAALLALAAPRPAAAQADDLAARTKGSASAPVTVYEMSDYQCPYCRRHVLETFPELERDYVATGKVKWVFINLPLTQIHPNALPAAEFSMCAARAGKFWPAHDILFKHQQVWAPMKDPGQFMLSLADSIGLPRSAVTGCLQKGETRAAVKADADGAIRSGARSTPTFYIEGGLLVGAQSPAVFREVLDSVYKAKARK